jgi:flagellar biosynthesis protein FliR
MTSLTSALPHRWAAEIFSTGLWIALPIFAIGFPITLGIGLVGMFLTLPMTQQPFLVAVDRVLMAFR